ncbi:biliverdin-producing heme oxygenase [Sphingomonas sp. MMS24-JH45]
MTRRSWRPASRCIARWRSVSWSRASTDRLSASALLREATRPAHDGVDAADGRFDLGVREDYAAFLTAHARALPAAEARMAMLPFAATLPPRAPLLAADLAALDVAPPDPLALPTVDEAAAWGTLYVVEGSRLGGAMLARGVPRGGRRGSGGPCPWRVARDPRRDRRRGGRSRRSVARGDGGRCAGNLRPLCPRGGMTAKSHRACETFARIAVRRRGLPPVEPVRRAMRPRQPVLDEGDDADYGAAGPQGSGREGSGA